MQQAQHNAAQQQAISCLEGPLLILAGAGTGKTRVLTYRIAELISSKTALAGEILAVTFTNKAAKEMQQRVANILGYDVSSMYLGTFHSISAKILRSNAEYVGLNSNFVIIDSDDQLRLLKNIITNSGYDTDKLNPKAVLQQISLWKDKAYYHDDNNFPAHFNSDFHNQVKEIYNIYQSELLRANSCDFGDLILHVIRILRDQPQIQQIYTNRFKYILVDEYQDTNTAQYLWLRLLAQGHNNICCVGDDDQSIYAFRGAEVENILRFEHDFTGAQIVKLEDNYRSTKHILNAASTLIAQNKSRHSKVLRTAETSGEKVKIIANWDDRAESKRILEEIELLKIKGIPYNEMAILVRAFFQTRSLEEALIANATPYKVVGGLRFYERKEIKDLIAYLRVVLGDNDLLAIERIINVPKRAVGAASFNKVNNYAREHGITIIAAIREFCSKKLCTGKTLAGLTEFLAVIDSCRNIMQQVPLKELAEHLIAQTSYEQYLKDDAQHNSDAKLENIKEFCESLYDFANIQDFLDHVGLVSELQQEQENNNVTISTLHAAKGLEYEAVFLAGWEEGVFPHQRSIDESGNKGLEEERRLAYVGITRAKTRLYISYASNRRMYNRWQASIPSKFLQELPQESISYIGNGGVNYNIKQQQKTRASIGVSKSLYKAKFSVTDKVIHENFGEGQVKTIIGDVAEISFNSGKTRFVTAKTLKKIS